MTHKLWVILYKLWLIIWLIYMYVFLIKVNGYCLVKNCPTEKDSVLNVSDYVSHSLWCHKLWVIIQITPASWNFYGKTFDVVSSDNAINVAYSNLNLPGESVWVINESLWVIMSLRSYGFNLHGICPGATISSLSTQRWWSQWRRIRSCRRLCSCWNFKTKISKSF